MHQTHWGWSTPPAGSHIAEEVNRPSPGRESGGPKLWFNTSGLRCCCQAVLTLFTAWQWTHTCVLKFFRRVLRALKIHIVGGRYIFRGQQQAKAIESLFLSRSRSRFLGSDAQNPEPPGLWTPSVIRLPLLLPVCFAGPIFWETKACDLFNDACWRWHWCLNSFLK